MEFKELKINEKILKAIESIGYTELTDVQEKSIPLAVEHKDMLVRSQTGSGKTMAYGIPLIQNLTDENCIQSLVVCPTRELAVQVSVELKKLTKFMGEGIVCAIYGGADMHRQIKALKNGAKIVVGTPGRIIDHIGRHSLKLHNVNTLVLDEADEMLNMGFKEDIEEILKAMPKEKQTMLFSATFPNYIKHIAETYLLDPVTIEIGMQNSSLKNISQEYAQVKRNGKKDALLKIFEDRKPYLSIVFCNTKKMTEEVEDFLNSNNIVAVALHGDKRQSERARVMRSIKKGDVAVLVATDVAARGIDINGVDYVINYDIPHDTEYFLHRIGRTARAGKTGTAITIVSTSMQLSQLLKIGKETDSDIKKYDLGDLNGFYAKSEGGDNSSYRGGRRSSGYDSRRNSSNGRSESRGYQGNSDSRSRSSSNGRSDFGGRSRDDSRSRSYSRDDSRSRSSYGDKPRDDSRSRSSYGDKPRDDSRSRSSYGDKPRNDSRSRSSYGDKPRDDSRSRSSYSSNRNSENRSERSYSNNSDRSRNNGGYERKSYSRDGERNESFAKPSDRNNELSSRFGGYKSMNENSSDRSSTRKEYGKKTYGSKDSSYSKSSNRNSSFGGNKSFNRKQYK